MSIPGRSIHWPNFLPIALLLLGAFGWLNAWSAALGLWFGLAEGRPVLPLELTAAALIVAALGTAGGLRLIPRRVARLLIAIVGLVLAIAVGGSHLSIVIGRPGQPWVQVGGAPELADLAAAGLILVAWWQGIAAGRARVTIDQVEASFRTAILALVSLLLINALVPAQSTVPVSVLIVSLLIVLAAGLIGLPLARISDLNARRRSDRPLSVSRPWLTMLIGVIGALLGLAGLIAALVTFERIDRLTGWLAAPLNALLWLLLEVILTPIGYLLDFLIRWLRSLQNPEVKPITFDPQTPNLADQLRTQAQASDGSPGALLLALKVIVIVALASLIVWVLARAIFRYAEWSSNDEVEEARDFVWSWPEFSEALLSWFRARFRRPREARSGDSAIHDSLWRQAEVSLDPRSIYREFLRLGARRGHRRRTDETPREYAKSTVEGPPWNMNRREVGTITDVYSQARYGEVPASSDQVARAYEALEALRQQDQGAPLN